MTGPSLISGGVTALELVADIVLNSTSPVLVYEQNLFVAYMGEDSATQPGLIYHVLEGPAAAPEQTMGTVVAVEHQSVDVIVFGNPGDYKGPKDEALRLRYLIMSMGDHVFNGLRMLYANPRGNVVPLGRDKLRRCNFMVSFDVACDPSYDRSYDA